MSCFIPEYLGSTMEPSQQNPTIKGKDTIVINNVILFSFLGSISVVPVSSFMVGSFGIPTTQKMEQNELEERLIPLCPGLRRPAMNMFTTKSTEIGMSTHSLICVTKAV